MYFIEYDFVQLLSAVVSNLSQESNYLFKEIFIFNILHIVYNFNMA